MYLKNITLTNFRNYELQKIDLINGVNLFVGDNAQGKTNIIESVYLCSIGKSYRTIKDEEVVKFNSDFTRVEVEYIKNNIENKVEVYIDKQNKKLIKNNGVKVNRLIDFVGEIPVVIFSPDSLDIVKGAPGKRRKFIDMICSQLSKSYLINLNEYNKCLKQKNSILKQDSIDNEYLDILNEKMSDYIEKIVNYRSQIIDKLNIKAKVIEKSITSDKEEIEVGYISDFFGMNKTEIKSYLDKYINIEKLRKSTVKGIQRDDLSVLVNGLEVSKFGSQGQNRTALLTLKLADFEVITDEKEETPILLLDDIMSELDRNRISFLLKYIEKYQSIITTTDSNFVKEIQNFKISKVLNGRLEI